MENRERLFASRKTLVEKGSLGGGGQCAVTIMFREMGG